MQGDCGFARHSRQAHTERSEARGEETPRAAAAEALGARGQSGVAASLAEPQRAEPSAIRVITHAGRNLATPTRGGAAGSPSPSLLQDSGARAREFLLESVLGSDYECVARSKERVAPEIFWFGEILGNLVRAKRHWFCSLRRGN